MILCIEFIKACFTPRPKRKKKRKKKPIEIYVLPSDPRFFDKKICPNTFFRSNCGFGTVNNTAPTSMMPPPNSLAMNKLFNQNLAGGMLQGAHAGRANFTPLPHGANNDPRTRLSSQKSLRRAPKKQPSQPRASRELVDKANRRRNSVEILNDRQKEQLSKKVTPWLRKSQSKVLDRNIRKKRQSLSKHTAVTNLKQMPSDHSSNTQEEKSKTQTTSSLRPPSTLHTTHNTTTKDSSSKGLVFWRFWIFQVLDLSREFLCQVKK